jgi:hypothetical protein
LFSLPRKRGREEANANRARYSADVGDEMKVQIAEMAGGLLQLALWGAVIFCLAEAGCRLFFWVRERGGER